MNENNNLETNKKVLKPRGYLMILEWIIALYFKVIGKVKVKKENFKSFKEPSIILSNHGSMIDFANVVLAMFPYRTCWVASIEEFNDREWLFRHLGVFPKRKFTTDLLVIKRITDLIKKRKMSVTIYPEARFSLAGVNEDISPALGKLAKLCKCRVIMLKQNGNYLFSPQWHKHPYRRSKVEVNAIEVFSKENAINLSEDELQKKIEDQFHYDEYKWAYENNILIKSKERATNVHKILYKCPICNKEGMMDSKGINLWCNNCHTKWEMEENSTLKCLNNEDKFKLVSSWYKWEKEEAYKEVYNGTYHFEDDVRIEKLINSKIKFKTIGTIHMTHDDNGFTFLGKLDDGTTFNLNKVPTSTRSVHIEYNYKGRGDALDIATLDETWWVFPLHNCCLTKFNFTTEALFEKHTSKKA